MILESEVPFLFFSGNHTHLFCYHNNKLNSKVILKVISEKNPSRKVVKEFENEYSVTSLSKSPVIRKGLGKTFFRERPALILEYVEGKIIDPLISRKTLNFKEFLDLAIKITRALVSLHDENIIHKNMDGSNILLDSSGNIRFIDLGIAKKIKSGLYQKPTPGIIEGNLSNLPPEQTGRVSKNICPGSILYSVGILFYRMLTGGFPYVADDPLELLHFHIAGKPISVNQGGSHE